MATVRLPNSDSSYHAPLAMASSLTAVPTVSLLEEFPCETEDGYSLGKFHLTFQLLHHIAILHYTSLGTTITANSRQPQGVR